MDSKAGAVTFGPGKGSPVATNYCWCSITVGDGVGVLVVSTKTFFFISQPIVVELRAQVDGNIVHNCIVSKTTSF